MVIIKTNIDTKLLVDTLKLIEAPRCLKLYFIKHSALNKYRTVFIDLVI